MADSYYIIKEYKPKPTPKQKTARKKRKLLKALLIIAVLTGLCVWYYFGRIAPVIHTIIEEKSRMLISEAIDDSASELVDDLTYDDYIIMRTDAEGHLTYLGINSVSMNKFSRKVTELVRNRMTAFETNGVSIPMGAFTGIAFMSGIGPEVQLQVATLAVVDANFTSSFTDAGINQTLHRLYIIIEVSGDIVLPGYTRPIVNSSQILVSESVIVGKTPNTYLDFN